MNNVANVDYDDLDAIVMWQKSTVEIFEKFWILEEPTFEIDGRGGSEANGHLLEKSLVGNPSP